MNKRGEGGESEEEDSEAEDEGEEWNINSNGRRSDEESFKSANLSEEEKDN